MPIANAGYIDPYSNGYSPYYGGNYPNSYTNTPFSYDYIQSQLDQNPRFLSYGKNYVAFLGPNEIGLLLGQNHLLNMNFLNANNNVQLDGAYRMYPGNSFYNYFYNSNNEYANIYSQLPAYRQANYSGLYPGVDMTYYSNQDSLAYNFLVQPNTDPRNIVFDFRGAKIVGIDNSGNLIVHMADNQDLRCPSPSFYQKNYGTFGSQTNLTGGYRIINGTQVGFDVNGYDANRPIYIDRMALPTAFGNYYDGVIQRPTTTAPIVSQPTNISYPTYNYRNSNVRYNYNGTPVVPSKYYPSGYSYSPADTIIDSISPGGDRRNGTYSPADIIIDSISPGGNRNNGTYSPGDIITNSLDPYYNGYYGN